MRPARQEQKSREQNLHRLTTLQKLFAAEMVQTQAMTPEQATAFLQPEMTQWPPTARRISETK
jgi:hypothetical protein